MKHYYNYYGSHKTFAFQFFFYFCFLKENNMIQFPSGSLKTLRIGLIILFVIFIAILIFQYHVPKGTFEYRLLFTFLYVIGYALMFFGIRSYYLLHPQPKSRQKRIIGSIFFLISTVLQISQIWLS